MTTICRLIIFCWLGPSVASGVSLSLPASRDNTLYEDSLGGFSNGAGEYMFVGKTVQGSIRRAVPAGAVVRSASVRLHVSKTISGSVPTALHCLTSNWGEGTSNAGSRGGGGTFAQTNDATWLHTFYSAQFWTNPGGDFLEDPSAQQNLGAEGFYVWGPTPELAADVTHWHNAPGANFGWILISDEIDSPSAKRLDTRTHLDSARRPVLLLEVDVPLRILGTTVVSNHLSFSFSALANQSYVIEQRATLVAGFWSALTNIAAAPALRTITIRRPLTTSRQFHRVVAP